MSNDDLLQPTLSEYRKPPALYHSTGFFLSAFFGGPMGAAIYASANAWRLGRLKGDLPLIVAIVAGAFLVGLEANKWGLLTSLSEWLGGSDRRNLSVVLRALGLACFGAIYLLHRRFYRAARVSGVEPLSGWVPGVIAVLVGFGVNVAFAGWIAEHH